MHLQHHPSFQLQWKVCLEWNEEFTIIWKNVNFSKNNYNLELYNPSFFDGKRYILKTKYQGSISADKYNLANIHIIKLNSSQYLGRLCQALFRRSACNSAQTLQEQWSIYHTSSVVCLCLCAINCSWIIILQTN